MFDNIIFDRFNFFVGLILKRFRTVSFQDLNKSAKYVGYKQQCLRAFLIICK